MSGPSIPAEGMLKRLETLLVAQGALYAALGTLSSIFPLYSKLLGMLPPVFYDQADASRAFATILSLGVTVYFSENALKGRPITWLTSRRVLFAGAFFFAVVYLSLSQYLQLEWAKLNLGFQGFVYDPNHPIDSRTFLALRSAAIPSVPFLDQIEGILLIGVAPVVSYVLVFVSLAAFFGSMIQKACESAPSKSATGKKEAEEVIVEPNDHVTALRDYNSAAQFNATSMVVVVFGQFGILMLLEGRAAQLLVCVSWACLIRLLIGVYACILFLGCYFILNYLMFAQFIEKLREYPGVKPLEKLENELAENTKKRPLKNFRARVLALPYMGSSACIAYWVVSLLVLWAVLNLPPRLN